MGIDGLCWSAISLKAGFCRGLKEERLGTMCTFRLKKYLLPCCVLVILAGNLAAQTVSPEEAHRKAEALLQKMTVDEKVGQLNQSSGVIMPMLGNEKPDDLVVQGRVGSI